MTEVERLRAELHKYKTELTETRRQLEIAQQDMRCISGGQKQLVRCGCLGCLTDDCDHWGKDCTLKDFTLCHIGRTIEPAPQTEGK